jgi:hypothetical protein
MKILTDNRDLVATSSATVVGGFSVGKRFFKLCCFLMISGTTLFAQETNGKTENLVTCASISSMSFYPALVLPIRSVNFI